MSNIPFGNFSVYDEAFPDKELSGKIHNYFFAKGLDKLAEGGLMAFITTDAFLNSPSNHTVREYLFQQADFVSVACAAPMKDNIRSSNHLLIVQKHKGKEQLSDSEKLLLDTVELKNEYGSYHQNLFLFNHKEVIIGNKIIPGKNQYGQAHETVWQEGDINKISDSLYASITAQFQSRFNA